MLGRGAKLCCSTGEPAGRHGTLHDCFNLYCQLGCFKALSNMVLPILQLQQQPHACKSMCACNKPLESCRLTAINLSSYGYMIVSATTATKGTIVSKLGKLGVLASSQFKVPLWQAAHTKQMWSNEESVNKSRCPVLTSD